MSKNIIYFIPVVYIETYIDNTLPDGLRVTGYHRGPFFIISIVEYCFVFQNPSPIPVVKVPIVYNLIATNGCLGTTLLSPASRPLRRQSHVSIFKNPERLKP